MRRAFLKGLRIAARHWLLGVVLWIVSILFGAAFAWASGYWLAQALDGSLFTRTLLRDLDPNVFVDLLYHHGESLQVLLVVAAFMAVIYLGLWLWFHAAIILAVQARDGGRLPLAFARGVEVVPLMARLFVIAAGLLGGFSFVVADVTWRLIRATFAEPSEMISYYLAAAGASVWVLGYVALVAIHDHARLRACATGGGALQSYWWATRFVLRGGERAYPLAVVLHLTAACLWLAFETIEMNFSATSGLAVAGLFVWGELYLLLRMWLRVWFFAAQNDLQSLV